MNTQDTIEFWIQAAKRYPLLKPDQVLEISYQIHALERENPRRTKLIQKLVNHNLRLVVSFVRNFMRTSHNKWGSVETVDYLQQGAIGLMRAAEKFDPQRGYSFSTYANHWIRSSISRYNMKTLTPVHVSESTSRQIMFYRRNGYMKAKANQRRMTDAETSIIVQRAVLAYKYCSLDNALDSGDTLVGMIPDTRESFDMTAFGEELDQAFAEAGVSLLGKEIVISSTIYDEGLREISERLGISIHKAKKEKSLAMRQLKAHPEAFGVGTL